MGLPLFATHDLWVWARTPGWSATLRGSPCKVPTCGDPPSHTCQTQIFTRRKNQIFIDISNRRSIIFHSSAKIGPSRIRPRIKTRRPVSKLAKEDRESSSPGGYFSCDCSDDGSQQEMVSGRQSFGLRLRGPRPPATACLAAMLLARSPRSRQQPRSRLQRQRRRRKKVKTTRGSRENERAAVGSPSLCRQVPGRVVGSWSRGSQSSLPCPAPTNRRSGGTDRSVDVSTVSQDDPESPNVSLRARAPKHHQIEREDPKEGKRVKFGSGR